MRTTLLTVISLLCTVTLSFSQEKRALVVAVGDYPIKSKVPPIASVNDIKYIKAALLKHGFTEKNIDTLINAKATKAAILDRLTSLAAKSKRNDVVVLHFACHGQQIRDQRTVELGKDEDDGYDEALLPYDAEGTYRATGYRGQNHLRDDDLYPKLQAIRKNIGSGGSLLVMIDACHSGTGTRASGFGTSRGEPIPFPDPENPIDSVVSVPDSGNFFDVAGDSLSNMVVISGSGPHQENKQMIVNFEELGSLSYSFYKAINEMPASSTYGFLYEKIKANIQAAIPDQLPMIEGDRDQVIFSGRYTGRDDKIYLRVGLKATATLAEDTVFTIDKGMMDNIAPGATGHIYISGESEPYTTAVIRKTQNFLSIGVARKKLKRSQLYELKLDEENFGHFAAGLHLKLDRTDKQSLILEKQVQELVRPYKFISLHDQADFQFEIKSAEGQQQAVLIDRNNRLVWSQLLGKDDSLSVAHKKALLADIKRAMRVKYLRTLPDGGELAKWVQVTIVPEKNPADTLEPTLVADDIYSLRIENKSRQKLFYTVIDILPDNTVEILYPYKDKEPANYSIAKEDKVIRRLKISENSLPGREVLKVIISRDAMDLRSVFERKKERSDNNSFQRVMDDLFKDSDDGRATRSDISSISVEEIGILTVAFQVKKK